MGSCNCSQNTGCRPDIFDRISTRNAGRRDKSCALNRLFPTHLFVYTIYEKRKRRTSPSSACGIGMPSKSRKWSCRRFGEACPPYPKNLFSSKKIPRLRCHHRQHNILCRKQVQAQYVYITVFYSLFPLCTIFVLTQLEGFEL